MLGNYPIASAPLCANPNEALDALPFSSHELARVNLVGSDDEQIFGFKMIQNFTIVSGDTHSLVVRVKDEDGNAVDISGATIKWRAARSLGKTADITKQTGGSGVTITDGTNGVFVVTLNASDTESLAGIFYHEAQVTFLADSTVATVVRGTMKIDRDLIVAT